MDFRHRLSRVRGVVGRALRPLLPGWPDAGRRIVQMPALREFLESAARRGGINVALNAGCGEGLFADLLTQTCRPHLQIEMDLSAAGARHVRFPWQRYLCGSLGGIPLAAASVDLLLCTEVLEHIPNDGGAVEEIARVLRPGGWLVLSVPTPPAVPDPHHVREGYTLEALERLMGARGLRCMGSRTCMHLFFRSVLRWWRPGRVPRAVITTAAWLDRALPVGPPMDLVVLARKNFSA